MSLLIENVQARYKDVPVLNQVSLAVPAGACIGLIGRNGAGKTTLLRAILNQLPWYAGTIQFGDRNLTKLSTPQIVNCGIAYVPQARSIFPELTVGENLQIPPIPKHVVKTRLASVLEEFPLFHERWHQVSGTLSGGERQLLSFARASLYGATLLLLDEPTANLSVSAIEQVTHIIQSWRKKGISFLIVEHNLEFLIEVCDRLYGIERGLTCLDVLVKDLHGPTDPILQRFFGLDVTEASRPETTN